MNLKLFFSARRQPILSYLEQQQKLFRESSASICNKIFLGNSLDDKDEINYISGLSCTTICKKQCVQVVRHRKSLLAENGCGAWTSHAEIALFYLAFTSISIFTGGTCLVRVVFTTILSRFHLSGL